jgi:hypothetical protein
VVHPQSIWSATAELAGRTARQPSTTAARYLSPPRRRTFSRTVGMCFFQSLYWGQIESLIAEGISNFRHLSSEERSAEIVRLVKAAFQTLPEKHRNPFSILHASRERARMNSRFRLWSLGWASQGGWAHTEVHLKTESVLPTAVGSGRQMVTSREEKWSRQMGPTSRGVFGSFCEALRSSEDPRTGGAPQIARIYRQGEARHLGSFIRAGVISEAWR